MVERFFGTVIPRLLKPSYVYQPPNPASLLSLLLAYAVAGALFQILSRTIGRRLAAGDGDSAARIGFILLFGANMTYEFLVPFVGSNRHAAAVALTAQMAAAIAGIVFESRLGWPKIFGGVTLATFLLLPWFLVIDVFAERNLWMTAAGGCLAGGGVIALSWLSLRHLPPRVVRAGVAAAGILILASCLFGRQTVRQAPPPPVTRAVAKLPNIILITLDTVRADHLSVYGYSRATSPNLAQFARQSTLFTNAFSSGDMTLATHASLFTGLEVRVHGAHYQRQYRLGRPVARSVPTMSSILAGRGYDTVGVVANAGYLGHSFGLDRGFLYWDQRVATPFFSRLNGYFISTGLKDAVRRFLFPKVRFDPGRSADEVNRDVEEALEQRRGRLLLFINYLDAHWPYQAPAAFGAMFPESQGNDTTDDYIRHALRHDASPEYVRMLGARYDASIRYVDEQLGTLFDSLKRRGLYDDALIIVTADHGEAFGEHHLLSHGVSAYEDQIRVPLLVKAPGQQTARVVSTAVSSTDVFGTVMRVCGGPAPEGSIDLRTAPEQRRVILAEHFGADGSSQTAITDGKWKLIRDDHGSLLLYDVTSDPLERHDLSKQPAFRTVRNELTATLQDRVAQLDHSTVWSHRRSDTDQRLLRSLGYLH
ncbi:MAG TPA: sulfatase [Thermoanaerobaculia bacterium]|nr:sulfatase [Thermoanaerobaculia bacterium]